MAIAPPIASTPVRADSPLGRGRIRVVAVVQDHQLHIAEQRLDWIVIRASLGQTHPVQLQRAHGLPGRARLARMRSVLIQHYPNFLVRIPAPNLPQETDDRR